MFKTAIISALLVSTFHAAPAAASPQQARRAADFLNSIGVNLHMQDEWDTAYSDAANGGTGGARAGNAAYGPVQVNNTVTNVSKVIAAMRYVGISHVRGAVAFPYIRDRLLAVMQGVPNLKILDQIGISQNASISSQLDLAGSFAWAIDSFEGLNEAALNASYAGQYGAGADCQYQIDLHNALQSFRPAHNMWAPLLAPTVSGQNWSDYDALARCAWASDAANGHFYSDSVGPTQQMQYDWPFVTKDAPGGAPVYDSESGFVTNNASPRGMTEDVAAKRLMQSVLGFYSHGIVRSFLYELVDEHAQNPQLNDNWNSDEVEQHLGLFHNDYSAKAGANMLHSQSQILADNSGSANYFNPGSLSYTLSGMPSTASSLLLQKADGTFVLAIWDEPTNLYTVATNNSWGYENGTGSHGVNVTFDHAPGSTAIYDTFNTNSHDGNGNPAPIGVQYGTNQTWLELTDHPLYLVIRP